MSSLIGVAIAVPDPWGADIERRRAELGDPQAGAIPAHITLLPPTRVGADRLDDVEQHLARATAGAAPFVVRLRGTGTFRPVSPVVFVALSAGISGCESLESQVRTEFHYADQEVLLRHLHHVVADEVADYHRELEGK